MKWLILILTIVTSYKVYAGCNDYSVPKVKNNELQNENIRVNVCFGKIPLMVEQVHFDSSDFVNIIRVKPEIENESVNFTFIDKSKKGYLLIKERTNFVKLDRYRNFKYKKELNSLSFFETVYVHQDNKMGVLPLNQVEYWINGMKIASVDYRPSVDIYQGQATVCQVLDVIELNQYYQVKLYVDNGSRAYLHLGLNGTDGNIPTFHSDLSADVTNKKVVRLSDKTINYLLVNINKAGSKNAELQCQLSRK